MKQKPPVEQGTGAVETATPPISETTAQTAAITETPVETVAIPPISETGKPPATVETQVSQTELLAQNEQSNAAVEQATPVNQAPTNVGRGSRTFQDWLKEDWTKGNADLAKEHGISRQAVAQMRKKVENHKAGGTPDFADVSGKPATVVEQVVNYDVMAVTVFDMSTGMLTMMLGPEWQPKTPEEKQMMCMGLKNYFASKQMQDLPPGLMLTAICLAYAAPRFREPSTSGKLKLGFLWLKDKWSKFRNRKKKVQP